MFVVFPGIELRARALPQWTYDTKAAAPREKYFASRSAGVLPASTEIVTLHTVFG
jgi:hypothetical protein